MQDIKTREDIVLLVDTFYKKALIDNEIGYFFTEIIKIDFEEHMPRLYTFWESVLFGKATFRGNPILKHIELNNKAPITSAHFNRWLQLWEQTTNSLFKGGKATEAINKAVQIGQLMQFKIAKHA